MNDETTGSEAVPSAAAAEPTPIETPIAEPNVAAPVTESATPAAEEPAPVPADAGELPEAANDPQGEELDPVDPEVSSGLGLYDRIETIEKTLSNLVTSIRADIANLKAGAVTEVTKVEQVAEGWFEHIGKLIDVGIHDVEGFFHLHSEPVESNATEAAKNDSQS